MIRTSARAAAGASWAALSARSRWALPSGRARARRRIRASTPSLCLGCGVCVLKCESRALRLEKRAQRVFTPETTFERVILQCLEQGTLENQIFDNPQSKTQEWMRGFLGGFFRLPPVKKALLSDTLRSTFLASMSRGVRMQGKGWVTRL